MYEKLQNVKILSYEMLETILHAIKFTHVVLIDLTMFLFK